MEYTKPLAQLIEFFQKFPGIGPKSAQRMAFHLLKMPLSEVQRFSQVLVEAKENIHYCSICFNMSASNPCEICSDDKRDKSVICVVAETKDLIAIEKTREYKGLYHVLQGTLSPLDGIGVEDIRIKELLTRVTDTNVNEVILALSPSVEGEATSMYITKLLKPFNIKISRIAFGLPIGSDLEYADEITLAKAIEGRRIID
ncbi:TPA: recombination protein RecR [Candidatus Avigastranaerophilus faecigallinarum]|nr:recombination protein RecR [Candidatus Avigastranaerophilus faecigallinarum]